jgi:hypothetical protein
LRQKPFGGLALALRRDIAGDGEDFFRLAIGTANRGDLHVPPFARAAHRIRPALETAGLPRLRGCDRREGFLVPVALPETDPGAAADDCKIIDLHDPPATCVHQDQIAIKVEQLDAVRRTLHHAVVEFGRLMKLALDRLFLRRQRGGFEGQCCKLAGRNHRGLAGKGRKRRFQCVEGIVSRQEKSPGNGERPGLGEFQSASCQVVNGTCGMSLSPARDRHPFAIR